MSGARDKKNGAGSKPALLAVNKVDTPQKTSAIYEFSAIGIHPPYPISSLHGRGIGDLLDAVVEELQKRTHVPLSQVPIPSNSQSVIRVAIVGRPNVGKSSLINHLLHEERVLVDDAPGTTRDPIETHLVHEGQSYCLIDTAGMRSRRRLKTMVDAVARIKASEVIRLADVCLGILEGPVGILQDDLKLLDQVLTAGKPLCLVVNKWDLLKRGADPRQVTSEITRRAPFLRFAPVICTSAKTGLNVFKVLEIATELAKKAAVRMTATEGHRLLERLKSDPRVPVAVRNAHLFRIAQVGISPPTFHLLVREKGSFRTSDAAYLEGVIRREFDLKEVPIRLHLLGINKRDGARR